MEVTPQRLPDVLLVAPRVFGDDRGYFFESFRSERYAEAGIAGPFVQDNVSKSRRGVLRGLHYQHPTGQGKLVMVMQGEIWDVAVDIRRGSPTFGQWTAATLSSDNHHQLWIPVGFAHGFCVVSDEAIVAYKCSADYDPKSEGTIRYDDPALAIDWPVSDPTVSEKDERGVLLADMPAERLPSA